MNRGSCEDKKDEAQSNNENRRSFHNSTPESKVLEGIVLFYVPAGCEFRIKYNRVYHVFQAATMATAYRQGRIIPKSFVIRSISDPTGGRHQEPVYERGEIIPSTVSFQSSDMQLL